MSAHDFLREFFELNGFRFAFDRNDGTHYEGYPVDVEPDRVLFFLGGPLAPDEPEWIAFDSIRLEGLSYWDEREKRWVDVVVKPSSIGEGPTCVERDRGECSAVAPPNAGVGAAARGKGRDSDRE